MKLTANIEKRYFFGILGAILLVVGIFAVYAFTGPNGVGHELNEVNLPSCSDGQALVKTADGWGCGSGGGIGSLSGCRWYRSSAFGTSGETLLESWVFLVLWGMGQFLVQVSALILFQA